MFLELEYPSISWTDEARLMLLMLPLGKVLDRVLEM